MLQPGRSSSTGPGPMVKDRDNRDGMSGCDRREHGRFAARLPALACRDDQMRAGRPSQCRIRLQDFSLGGLRVESDVPLKINERVTLRLPSLSGHPPVELTGRVVHCRRDEAQYQVGIAFCQTRPEAGASPWRRVFRLFSVAYETTSTMRPIDSVGEA